ncbi:hypothetical protein E8E15_004811 [Penicillium rubens]|nr:hypothetical protein E8E15_004811 [Penicillium rubens]
MAPNALRYGRQSAKNDSELVPLLRDGSKPPQKKSTRYDARTHLHKITTSNPLGTNPAPSNADTRYIPRKVSLLVEPRDYRGRINYHNWMRQMRKAPATEAVRLDWMRRLRPKPHRRV